MCFYLYRKSLHSKKEKKKTVNRCPTIPWRREFFRFLGVHTSGCFCASLCSAWCYESQWQCPSHVPPKLPVRSTAKWQHSAFFAKMWNLNASIRQEPWNANDSRWAPHPPRHPAVCFSDAWLSKNRGKQKKFHGDLLFAQTAIHRNYIWNLTVLLKMNSNVQLLLRLWTITKIMWQD